MPDYGHDLRFGIFPSPDAASAGRTLELAHLAEVSGLDLVSVQDHPYQARHLDTWTLLSVIAARTTSITVAPNVANLPLRPPVVLARSAATLDLLSGGRVELGLGAGAFWDAIVAAGGPRRTPGESVDALVEAIAVIRSVWSGETVREDGEHYRVVGLHGGPVPAHDIPIWLGAYKPRMLRATGRLADAWIPSMGYADPPALAAMNAIIDEEADRAGRGPQAVRRMYNVIGRLGGTGGGQGLQGTAQDWAEQLAGLALDEGISTFVLGADDPDVVSRFAGEVVPPVREQVDAERALRARLPGRAAGAAAGRDRPWGRDRRRGARHRDAAARGPPHAGAAVGRVDPAGLPGAGGSDLHRAQQAYPQHLVEVHDHLRGELAQLRDVVDQVRRGLLQVGQARSVINTMTMRQNNWTLGAYCESYCRILTTHHTLEDHSMFGHLRLAEPDAVPVLDRLEQEHHVIHDLLESLDGRLVELVGADPAHASTALEELATSIDRLADALLSHLSYEERELLHPLARHGMG